MVAACTAKFFGGDHLGRRSAVFAGESGARSRSTETGSAAGWAAHYQTPPQALSQSREALHPGRIEMGPHVGLKARLAVW